MKTALFSVSYAGLWGQTRLDLPDFIDRAHTLGYEGVMLMGKRPHASILDMTPDKRQALRERLERNGLPLASIAGYTNFTAGLESMEVPLVEMQVKYIEELARLASDLGGDSVRLFTGYEVAGQAISALWSRCVDALRICSDVAEPYGVTLGVQNHHDIGVHTDAYLELLNDVDRPNVKAMFDAWSPALRGEDLYTAAKKAAPLTIATTCADYVRLPRYTYQPDLINYRTPGPDLVRAVPMGEGCIDYRSFLQGLRDGGFDGWVNFEMCSPTRGGRGEANLDAFASQFLKYFRSLNL